ARQAKPRQAPRPAPAKNPVRGQLIGKIHVAKAQMGLDEETYRALLQRVTGQTSSKACSISELESVVRECVNLGWTPKRTTPARSGKARPMAASDVAAKARALWLSLWHLGVVRDPSESALTAFCERQTGMADLAWVRDQKQAVRLIEALKKMAARAGVDWGATTGGGGDRERVMLAQVKILKAAGAVPPEGMVAFALKITGRPAIFSFDERDWDALIAALGELVRAAAGRA
ncbi:MAG: regulatory protein GemA, partial [Caenispirillum sp.]|nr:regulatory protein GemA [Caenispirillum sp.]